MVVVYLNRRLIECVFLSGPSEGAIVGACIGAVTAILLLALIIFGLCFYRRKHRKMKKELHRYHTDRNTAPPVYVPVASRHLYNPGTYSTVDPEGQIHYVQGTSTKYPLMKDAPVPYPLSYQANENWKTKTNFIEKEAHNDYDNATPYRHLEASTSDQNGILTSDGTPQPQRYHPGYVRDDSETTASSLDSVEPHSEGSALWINTLDVAGKVDLSSARSVKSSAPIQVNDCDYNSSAVKNITEDFSPSGWCSFIIYIV